MFDYAMLTHLLELHVSEKSNKHLLVCESKNTYKYYRKKYKYDLNYIILTTNDIWRSNKLVGLYYHDYKYIW